jgi:hypothetical protein
MLNETNKYDFLMKYTRKYSSSIRYNDSLYFNLSKVLTGLESKFGEKLMIDYDARNVLCYYLVSLQYDFTNLALSIVKYSNRKTLNKTVLFNCCLFILDASINSKIKLKLDSLDKDDNEDNEENEDNVLEDETETETETEIESEVEAELVVKEELNDDIKIIKNYKIEKELETTESFDNDKNSNLKGSKNKKVSK